MIKKILGTIVAAALLTGNLSLVQAQELTKDDYANAATKIKAAVAAGKLSAQDGQAKLDGMRKKMSQQCEGDGASAKREVIKQKIEGAVERGDLTRAEADAKYQAIKERKTK